jgi:hypothetical protein
MVSLSPSKEMVGWYLIFLCKLIIFLFLFELVLLYVLENECLFICKQKSLLNDYLIVDRSIDNYGGFLLCFGLRWQVKILDTLLCINCYLFCIILSWW